MAEIYLDAKFEVYSYAREWYWEIHFPDGYSRFSILGRPTKESAIQDAKAAIKVDMQERRRGEVVETGDWIVEAEDGTKKAIPNEDSQRDYE